MSAIIAEDLDLRTLRQPRLGRLPVEDVRDTRFQMRSLLRGTGTVVPKRGKFHYTSGWWGDQGQTSQCVAYAWLHYLEDGPIPQPGPGPLFDPSTLYCELQEHDEWDGGCNRNQYDGTSVRAGAKVLQQKGLIGNYYWAWDGLTAAKALLKWPVVMGTWWRANMWDTDMTGFVHYSGEYEGGHGWLADGIWVPDGMMLEEAFGMNVGYVRCKNSWGRQWGDKGFFKMRLRDFDQAIREGGEACIATEIKKAA